jgi:integrase
MHGVKSKRIPPLGKAAQARFWAHVDRTTSECGCWLWTGSANSKGYGRFFFGGRHYYVHRLAWSLAGRETPVELQICHTCDTPLCVNPDHLMMADNATKQRDGRIKRNLAGQRAAAAKPYPAFPLFPHATGRWAKKIRGKFHYFGPTNGDPEGAAAVLVYEAQREDLYAGRMPRPSRDGFTVRDLCNKFLSAKEDLADSGEITRRTFADYFATCKGIIEAFGVDRLVDDLTADDFQALRASIAKGASPNTIGNQVQRIRTAFKFAYDSGDIDHPVRFGPTFKRPAKRIIRAHRQKNGKREFNAADLRKIIAAAPQPLRAMILLGVNCGFGNNDCGRLPLSAIDLKRGWVEYPRPKTAIERRCPLWPETVKALREAVAKRPKREANDTAKLAFVTRYGTAWAKDTADSPVSKEFRKLLDLLKLHRKGLGFYALRHVFETQAGECKDQVAVNFIMGHADESMAEVYREGISDDRLRACVNVVRKWLFPPAKAKRKVAAKAKAV